MTDSQNYNGTGKLAGAIANLCGLSLKSQGQIAALIKQAKVGLGITSKSKNLPDDVKLAIYQWHFDRLHPEADADVKIDSQAAQPDIVNIASHDDSNESVELYSHPTPPDSVEICSQPELSLPVDIISQTVHDDAVDIISQPDSNEHVEIISQYTDNALVRIAFYIQRKGARVRQVIALDGFYLNALMLATGITKQDVPKWVQQAVDGWAAFDAYLPITRQVKLLIVRAITQALDDARK